MLVGYGRGPQTGASGRPDRRAPHQNSAGSHAGRLHRVTRLRSSRTLVWHRPSAHGVADVLLGGAEGSTRFYPSHRLSKPRIGRVRTTCGIRFNLRGQADSLAQDVRCGGHRVRNDGWRKERGSLESTRGQALAELPRVAEAKFGKERIDRRHLSKGPSGPNQQQHLRNPWLRPSTSAAQGYAILNTPFCAIVLQEALRNACGGALGLSSTTQRV